MMVCGICSYPINVDTDEPIGSNFFLGSSHDPDDCLYRTLCQDKNLKIFKKSIKHHCLQKSFQNFKFLYYKENTTA